MEIAKISSKGQLTMPIQIRKKLNLDPGDKVAIIEENGRYYFENAAFIAFENVRKAFDGEAEKAGFKTEEEMQEYMKDIKPVKLGRMKGKITMAEDFDAPIDDFKE